MRHLNAVVAVVLMTLVGAFPSTLAGQAHTDAVGLTVGGSMHSDLTPGLSSTTQFQSGWISGLQYEHWLGNGRAGIRFNTLFTQRLLDSSPGGDYNVFMADVDAMLRILPPADDRVLSPFVAAGLGAVHYGSVAGTGPLARGVYGDNVVRPHILASVGADIGFPGTFGVRVEIGDQIIFPSVGYSPSFSGFPNVHNLLATVALLYRFGPPGPGPATPTPAPEPARAHEAPGTSVIEAHLAQIERLESRVAELNRQVDSLQTVIAQLRRRVPEAAPEPRGRAAYTVQVGAFLDPDRADRLTAELRADGVPTWRWDAVTRNRTFSRVRVGALQTREQAEQLARLLQQEKGLSFWVDRIEPEEDVPAGAVGETRAYLNARR